MSLCNQSETYGGSFCEVFAAQMFCPVLWQWYRWRRELNWLRWTVTAENRVTRRWNEIRSSIVIRSTQSCKFNFCYCMQRRRVKPSCWSSSLWCKVVSMTYVPLLSTVLSNVIQKSIFFACLTNAILVSGTLCRGFPRLFSHLLYLYIRHVACLTLGCLTVFYLTSSVATVPWAKEQVLIKAATTVTTTTTTTLAVVATVSLNRSVIIRRRTSQAWWACSNVTWPTITTTCCACATRQLWRHRRQTHCNLCVVVSVIRKSQYRVTSMLRRRSAIVLHYFCRRSNYGDCVK